MKTFRFLITLALLLFISSAMQAQVVSNNNEDEVNKVDTRFAQDFVPGQVLVKFKDESPVTVQKVRGKYSKSNRASLDNVLTNFGVDEMEKLFPREKPNRTLRKAKAYNGNYVEEKNLSQIYQIKIKSLRPDSVEKLVDALKELPEVEYAEPNYKVFIMGGPAEETEMICADPTQNPLYNQQWGLLYEGLPELWQKPIVNATRPVIAILDTGVDINHPDLVDNIWTNAREAEGESGYDNDNNGFRSDVHGWDFINNTADIRDFNSHGSHVAGIAAAADNGVGIIGANPQALIMPVTVMQSDGTGDVATIVRGINYAAANGATIINMSLGTYSNSNVMRQALEHAYQNAVIVAAAGNDGLGIYPECSSLIYKPMFPAAYSFVLGVQATTQGGGLAGFSNFDCDGPNFSAEKTLADEDGFNYELSAPGVGIVSSVPNGGYKTFNGTSMAAPLIAGAISALQMVKEYDNQEILWGDLTHSATILGAYNITEHPAELDLLKIDYDDTPDDPNAEQPENVTVDGNVDAGETVHIYPTLRTTWGAASNIRLRLEMGDEYEDPTMIEFIENDVDFGWNLSEYARNKSANPIVFKVKEGTADNRHIKLKLVATADESQNPIEFPFTIIVDNMTKISGLITKDTTLTADKVWYVYDNLAIAEGATLTIEPGTKIEFYSGMGISGKIIANGLPNKLISFTNHLGEKYWTLKGDLSLKYCKLDCISSPESDIHIEDCIIENYNDQPYFLRFFRGVRCNFIENRPNSGVIPLYLNFFLSNIVNNTFGTNPDVPTYSSLFKNNYFNNYAICKACGKNNKYYGKMYCICVDRSQNVYVDYSCDPSYLGTAREDLIRPLIFEIGNAPNVFGSVDLSNMPDRPYAEAHGIVWKVVVNGKDAQDEFEDLAPLGVGRHKFEVYFNRPMNVAVAPKISFGVREPYTQHAVTEDGSWSADSLIYTAYYTITGKTSSDGMNRIYVYGAEDNEYFEIPYEKTRFNINIQAAGSMATGFAGEGGLGKVTLTWNNEENDFDDAMGFNLYRFTMLNDSTTSDTLRVNTEIIDLETTEYIDYDVTPGTTYYYLYKVLSTDLREYDVSNTVAVTPLTSTKGDANGSGDVDVADVITTVNYAAGQSPKPFIFEAADMNEDTAIDILDVIGIIKTILNPNAEAKPMIEATATYTIEDGVVYVDSPVALAGVQVQVATAEDADISVVDDLKGFEHTGAWLSDNDYLFLAYNMNGKTLAPGKQALLYIGDSKISQMRLSDADGHNVMAVGSEATGIDRMATDVMKVKGIYDLQGRKISGNGDMKNLPKGIYIVNGQKVVR